MPAIHLDIDPHLCGPVSVGTVGIKGLWASWQARIPSVQTFHTMIQDTLPFYSPFGINLHVLERGLRLYLRVFLRKSTGVVVPSRAILEEILELSPEAPIADVMQQQAADVFLTMLGINKLGVDPRLVNRREREEETRRKRGEEERRHKGKRAAPAEDEDVEISDEELAKSEAVFKDYPKPQLVKSR